MQHLSLTVCQAAILKETVKRAKKAALERTGRAGVGKTPAPEVVKALKYLAIAQEFQAILDKLNGDPT